MTHQRYLELLAQAQVKTFNEGYQTALTLIQSGRSPQDLINASRADTREQEFTLGWRAACVARGALSL